MVGLAVVVAAGLAYMRSRARSEPTYGRTRPRSEDGVGDEGDDTDGVGDGVGDRDDDDESGGCDWALYLNNMCVRPARGHECCVYRIDVTSNVTTDDLALKGRQDVDPADGDRLRLPDGNVSVFGTDMSASATARSGPAGQLDWMQGLGHGDRLGTADDASGQGRQMRVLEEGPDVVARLEYDESTEVIIEFESGCRGTTGEPLKWLFSGDLTSESSLETMVECTNEDTEPECRIELTADGVVEASATGDLISSARCATGPDSPDELESMSGGGLGDDHDHGTRDRLTFEDTVYDGATDDFETQRAQVELVNWVALDAGSIVPTETWDTTGRVTADLVATTTHRLTVTGEPSEPCSDENCCRSGDDSDGKADGCRCNGSRFLLEISGRGSRLQAGNFDSPLSRPKGGGAWRLGASDEPGTN